MTGVASKTDHKLIAVCFLLALACLVAAVYELQILLPLVNRGSHADAQVVAVERGVKGTRKAVYRFVTAGGEEVVTPDWLDMYLIRFKAGERVVVFYDPSDPTLVTADLGQWVWQGPAIFLSGAVLLVALGLVLPRMKKNR